MPRQLALLLCVSFVWYILRYDRRQQYNRTWALWIPSLWMLTIVSRSLDTWFQVGGGSRESGGTLDPIFQASIFGLGLVILAKRNLNWGEVLRNNKWLFILLGYMLLSVVWSDLPARSLRSWIKEIVAVIMALLVVTESDPEQAMQSIFRRVIYILIPFSILLIKYYPDLGVIYSRWTGEIQWIGVALQKNSLGQLCSISTFFLVWTLIRRRKGQEIPVDQYQTYTELLLLLMTFWLFKGPSTWAASATSMVALGVGLTTLFALRWMNKHHIQLGTATWVSITAFIIALGSITPLVGGSTVTGFTSALGRDATLTGRTDIWTSLLPDVMRQPFLGYGFSGFWNPKRAIEHLIGEAHNGYLDVWLQLGLVGLCLTTFFLLSCVTKACRTLEINSDLGLPQHLFCLDDLY